MYAPPPLAVSPAPPTVAELVLLVALAVPYTWRARVLARGDRRVPGWRQLCFYAGVALGAVALVRPGEELLFVQTIWQLALGGIVPLLLVLGVTLPLLAPLMRVKPIDRLRVLTYPLVAFALWALNLCLWQLPSLYQAAMRHTGIAALQHALLLLAGVNVWMCLLGPLPTPAWFGNRARLVYIVAMWLTGATLGNLLLWSDAVFYPDYLPSDSLLRVSPLADQNLAGAAMTIEISVLTIGLFWWLFRRTARESAERRELLEWARRRGIALSERRASRAIAAGRGAELRGRLERHVASGEAESAVPYP